MSYPLCFYLLEVIRSKWSRMLVIPEIENSFSIHPWAIGAVFRYLRVSLR